MKKCIIIMAGGRGKRMNSHIPKVLHTINNECMIVKLIKEVTKINPDKILVIVGNDKDCIIKELNKHNFNIIFIFQNNPLGTGDAIKCCKDHIDDNSNILILSGDTPMITSNTMTSFLNSKSKYNGSIMRFGNMYPSSE